MLRLIRFALRRVIAALGDDADCRERNVKNADATLFASSDLL